MDGGMLSVGIDIGTYTTQVVFSRLKVKNTAAPYTIPHIVIAEKEIVHRGQVHLTPLHSRALIDGEAINSCLYLAVWAEGKNIITLEGLMNPDGTLSDIQKAFIDETAIQCGFCTPGFILTATEILNAGVEYTDDELRKLLSGHLCRCTGYQNIFRAVKKTMLRRLGKDAEAELVK